VGVFPQWRRRPLKRWRIDIRLESASLSDDVSDGHRRFGDLTADDDSTRGSSARQIRQRMACSMKGGTVGAFAEKRAPNFAQFS
jgi:hypothetical protein